MQEAIAGELVKQLQPMFYAIGSFTVIIFVTFGSALLKLILDSHKNKNTKIDGSLESLKNSIGELEKSFFKMETKLDLFIENHNKDINNLGRKVKELNS